MNSASFYKVINDVISTWDDVKKIPNYEARVGTLLFRSIFKKNPKVWKSFSFVEEKRLDNKEYAKITKIIKEFEEYSIYFSPNEEKRKSEPVKYKLLKKDIKFTQHTQVWVRMFDLAIDMVGPDLDVVESEFKALGSRHAQYAITREQLEIMGDALLDTLETILGKDSFDRKVKGSWDLFYSFICDAMLIGMKPKSLTKVTSKQLLLARSSSIRAKPLKKDGDSSRTLYHQGILRRSTFIR